MNRRDLMLTLSAAAAAATLATPAPV
ncbi:hypothetical protein CA238_16655, partial [Sphingomonas koreensis]